MSLWNVGDFKGSTLTLRSSKTDQEGAGETLYVCKKTRELLKQYRERAEIGRGAVFRHIRAVGTPSRIGLQPSRRVVLSRNVRTLRVLRVSSLGIRCGLGLPSRSPKLGATVVDMQVAGRWKSSQMPAHYAKAELAERGAIARFKDGKAR